MSEDAWSILAVILIIFAAAYWVALLLYIYWDDLDQVDHTNKAKSDTIVESEPPDALTRFRNLRRPQK